MCVFSDGTVQGKGVADHVVTAPLRVPDCPHTWDSCASDTGLYVCIQSTHQVDSMHFFKVTHTRGVMRRCGDVIQAPSTPPVIVWSFPPKEIPFSMAISKQQGLIAVGTYSGRSQRMLCNCIITTTTGSIYQFQIMHDNTLALLQCVKQAHAYGIRSIAYNDDGTQLASLDTDLLAVQFWNTKDSMATLIAQ